MTFFTGKAGSLFKSIGLIADKPSISPELAQKLRSIGHEKKLILVAQHLPPHKVLGQSRENLASLRLDPEQQGELSVVQSPHQSGFTPLHNYANEFTPPRIMIDGKSMLMESASNEELRAYFMNPEKVRHIDTQGQDSITLTLPEFRAIQDYMGRPGLSASLKQYMLGQDVADPNLSPVQLQEMALLIISGLNALPAAQIDGVHDLGKETINFENMAKAAKDKTPFVPDTFLSIKQSLTGKNEDLNPPDPDKGNSRILIKTNQAKDVRIIHGQFAHEREAIAAPFESYKVEKLNTVGQDKPVFQLTGMSQLRNN